MEQKKCSTLPVLHYSPDGRTTITRRHSNIWVPQATIPAKWERKKINGSSLRTSYISFPFIHWCTTATEGSLISLLSCSAVLSENQIIWVEDNTTFHSVLISYPFIFWFSLLIASASTPTKIILCFWDTTLSTHCCPWTLLLFTADVFLSSSTNPLFWPEFLTTPKCFYLACLQILIKKS